ncbi:glyoxalase [Saccharopolyspora indica]|uniref:VOC family protein n=1 Tax=Saccharopolyspora indica TaxID=1229659 RepID=UPI0022EB79FF|nr:VOC family protein [Saccharopolyspora indica]MDA3643994.1 glyoxalase [Saccharopolyspora indica]
MGSPVVHFEIIGKNPEKLHDYYGELFGWQFHVGDALSEEVSAPGRYGFVDGSTTGGINGGVGGGAGRENAVLVYIGVPKVEEALAKAESLGGKRVLGPVTAPGGDFVVAQFTDPEGNLIGLAGSE